MEFLPQRSEDRLPVLMRFLDLLAYRYSQVELRATDPGPSRAGETLLDNPFHPAWRRWYPDNETEAAQLEAWIAGVEAENGRVVVNGPGTGVFAVSAGAAAWRAAGPYRFGVGARAFQDFMGLPANVDMEGFIDHLHTIAGIRVDFLVVYEDRYWLGTSLDNTAADIDDMAGQVLAAVMGLVASGGAQVQSSASSHLTHAAKVDISRPSSGASGAAGGSVPAHFAAFPLPWLPSSGALDLWSRVAFPPAPPAGDTAKRT